MTKRFQFSLRDLFWLVLVVAGFLGGIRFEHERRERADKAAELASKTATPVVGLRTKPPAMRPQQPTEPPKLSDDVIFLPRRSREGD